MCDQQEKVKNKKTAAESQEMKHHHQPHHQQLTFHRSDEDGSQDAHSTAEDSLLSDGLPHQQHRSHRYRCKQRRGRLSPSVTSFTSSYGSSSSTFSSSSTTASSASCSSSSNSSTTSASSSSLSSESSTETLDRFLLRRPQHSQSWTNISGKDGFVEEEEDDTAPLVADRAHVGKQKQAKGKSARSGSQQGAEQTQNSASFRKSKSMEALARPTEREGHANEEEEENQKKQVRKNLMKEKMKFSAFLNEITRQVLSPMRLSTLGVTDAQKTSSAEPAGIRSRKSESNTGQQRSRPVSADSVKSGKYSHASLSKSKSFHRHRDRRSPDSTDRMQHRPRSCTDISCSERHPSRSPTSHDCSRSPSCKRRRRRNQGDHIRRCHHRSVPRSPSYHRHPRNRSPQRRRRCHSPVFYPDHGDRDTSSFYRTKRSPRNHGGERYSPSTHPRRTDYRDPAIHRHGDRHFHYPHGYHNRGHVPRHGDPPCTTYHREERHSRTLPHHQIHNGTSQHHEDHSIPHHLNPKRPTTPHRGNKTQSCEHTNTPYSKHHHGDHHGLSQHHSLKDQHHRGDPHNRQHGDRHSGIHQQHQGVHGDGSPRPQQRARPAEFELHRHGDHHRSSHQNQQGHRPSPNPQHHHGDDPDDVHRPDGDESQSSYREQRRGARRSPTRPHRPGDQHSPNHEDLHSNLHRHSHGESQNAGQQHGEPHNPNGQHHHRDQTGSHRQHHHGDHKSPNGHHQHEGHHRRVHQIQHGDPSHPEPHQNRHLSKNEPELEEKHDPVVRRSAGGLPPQQNKSGVLPCKPDSTRKITGRDEGQTDFTGPSIPQEPTHEMDTITVLQEENESLQQSFAKSAVNMEFLGEFLSSQKILEEELQRTREELSNLMESFQILHENCSSTQQTNSLLEQKLNSVTRSMEGERERLSRRISGLTEQLAAAKFADSVGTFNVKSALNTPYDRLHLDEAINQVLLPIAPPPIQFMDSQNYEKVKAAGQEQCLGSVPEEEESDWSETGDEIPRFILTGSNRSQAWMPGEGDTDKDSESGGEEVVRLPSPRPLQIPHLHFTIHNEILPAPPGDACPSGMTGESTFRITASPNLGSTVLIRSASLEEIPLACHQLPKELRGTEAVMDLRRPGDEAIDDFDNEIVHGWRMNNNGDGRASEADSAPCSLQSVEQMLNRFPREPQPGEGPCRRRSELHGWTRGIAEEVLGGEQTQL
ncbi:filaggrin-2 [Phyllopteryx taeniolatus]|uniref:filaggrin-2 n=1 Tax=Phyllopteryx taeniolatus TaxID=161469 RepID=UPI002AD4C5DA|nr:filaggrin-2 [Phyllopteryx taeniolatus]